MFLVTYFSVFFRICQSALSSGPLRECDNEPRPIMKQSWNKAVKTSLAILALGFCMGIACHLSASILYGADGAGGNLSNLYILNPADGSIISTVGPIGFSITGLAIDPTTGVLYGTTSRNKCGAR